MSFEQMNFAEVIIEEEKSKPRIKLKPSRDCISYKRMIAGKPNKIFLVDEATGERVATVFAGRKLAEWICLCVNMQS